MMKETLVQDISVMCYITEPLRTSLIETLPSNEIGLETLYKRILHTYLFFQQ